ncbi:helix-turn-helix transcriptional regulator [Cognatishimia maritima]|uniref:Transcriptional regulator, AraC family n=1 Tax=Cognatishimia maritima TaxID=870908 RepID=A0A1M5KI13_9RHOB|nr:AraC family transcriptional regulator [Cognatishimia maritima]SHG52514.1 transcriptional regulator, AraC family [Cognatishimia maritima]
MDRITTLMNRFHRQVRAVPAAEADLIVLGSPGAPKEVCFYPQARGMHRTTGSELWYARVDWAGGFNPLQRALPETVHFDLSDSPETQALIQVILQEHTVPRCGGRWVLDRLGDVLLVRLLRDQINRGSAQPGLIAGLADPRLSRAIVAMHDHPGRVWTNQDLATEAGLSLSRFNELFAEQVGETPMSYLRQWRLTLARQDLEKGDRVDAVARRYAYGSPEAFTRAYRKAFDESPIATRNAGIAVA